MSAPLRVAVMSNCQECHGCRVVPIYCIRRDTGAKVPWTGRGRLSAEAKTVLKEQRGHIVYTSYYGWALMRRCGCAAVGMAS